MAGTHSRSRYQRHRNEAAKQSDRRGSQKDRLGDRSRLKDRHRYEDGKGGQRSFQHASADCAQRLSRKGPLHKG
ncbi:MAG: hypothetical protein ACPGIH_11520 [Verrucomicrobiales bacterium]